MRKHERYQNLLHHLEQRTQNLKTSTPRPRPRPSPLHLQPHPGGQVNQILLPPNVVGLRKTTALLLVLVLILVLVLLLMTPKKYVIGSQGRRTHPLIWYDEAGLLVTQITIDILAENANAKAHATFQDTSFFLIFGGMEIAQLVAPPFDVKKNGSQDIHYVVESSPIPLDPEKMELVNLFIRRNDVVFELKGKFRAQWRVGLLGSVKFWSHLNCWLHFHPWNGTYTNPKRCSSKAK
ncbi:hypothetical protein CRG98_003058 [Punica granatum]|uniref:Late embryogenesis abundant protein LEA-2 subgroup domain-containing protein n=1 Tax=Punica granatum TaxID=22663 RepID=A0A2I0L724_PUNGR|nr:hypothetical protein CRG98_003058 [Punica granatum]